MQNNKSQGGETNDNASIAAPVAGQQAAPVVVADMCDGCEGICDSCPWESVREAECAAASQAAPDVTVPKDAADAVRIWNSLPDAKAPPAPAQQAPYSAPFTTDVPQCCESPETCAEPCQTAPAQQAGAAPTKIRTWQERTGNHNIRPGSVKHMLAEIAELRAQLAAAQQVGKHLFDAVAAPHDLAARKMPKKMSWLDAPHDIQNEHANAWAKGWNSCLVALEAQVGQPIAKGGDVDAGGQNG